MNSLIERLRLYRPIDNTSTLINEAATLIEQQAERIKELEAENTRLNNLYSDIEMRALMAKDSMGDERRPLLERLQANHEELTNARDTAQRRIKELEAAFAQVNRNRESVDALKNQLAALRQRIDDAPVVMWVHKDNDLLIRRTWPSEAGFYQLISKEDLK